MVYTAFGDGWSIGLNAWVFLDLTLDSLEMSFLTSCQNRRLGLGGIQYLQGTLYVATLAHDNTIRMVSFIVTNPKIENQIKKHVNPVS